MPWPNANDDYSNHSQKLVFFSNIHIFSKSPAKSLMGSGSSHHLGSSSAPRKSSGSRGSRLNRTRRKLSSMFCGVFASKSTFQLGSRPEKSSISCTENLAPVDGSPNSILESSSVFVSEAVDTISTQDNRDSFERNSSLVAETSVESDLLNAGTSRDLDPFPNQHDQELGSEDATDNSINAITEGTTSIYSEHDPSTSLAQGIAILRANSDNHEYNDIVGTNNSDLSEQDLTSGDLLHLDLVSISSNIISGSIAEISSNESRRNSRRLFWDALSRSSFRRHNDSARIVFATGLADDVGSNDRWLLDFGGDDFESFGARLHRRNERRWLLRSEVSERTIGGLSEGGRQSTFCASGLHLDGTCSCDSYFTAEESTNLASISRIIMLAEALFEVLDEIHHQSLSLSLSTLSNPAPDSVVDTFPLKCHKKIENVDRNSTDIQQCHICLSEYEEGDKLRVLPCNHEFHGHCVDKWLKEVNRVCPLCRHNVCESIGECSISNT